MEKDLLHKLYQRVREVDVKDFPTSALSGLLHGYLSVYSMIRVYPWLEDEFESPWDIHERVREIGRVIQDLLKDHDIPVDERAGYVVDLMDTYLMYSDIDILEAALDAAYEILIPKGSDKMVLPCRTANVCRMLCNCYYFTGDKKSGLLARSILVEALGGIRRFSCAELPSWWVTFQLYESVVDGMELRGSEWEQQLADQDRLSVSVELAEDRKIECLKNTGNCADIGLQAEVFAILAKREFTGRNEHYKQEINSNNY